MCEFKSMSTMCTCIYSFPGIPVIFVAVGLGSVRDEYGVKADDESDN